MLFNSSAASYMFEHFVKFRDLVNQESFYWFCALLGSGLYLIQLLLTLLGNADNEGLDGAEVDAVNVKWLSKQAITGFLMMFGWSALTCQNQFNLPRSATLAIALAVGVVTVIVTGFLFKMARKLHSPGTVFALEDAIGKEAVVYQRIPKGGIGKISISLHQLTHEIDARAENDEDIPSFAFVRVIKKSDNTLIVTPIKQ